MKRTAYQEQIDALHVSKEKKEETLRLMLEENKRLRQAEEKKSSRFFRTPRMTLYAVAAACLLLVFFGFGQLGGKSPYLSVRTSQLPTAVISRGNDEITFSDAFGCEAEWFFKDWSVQKEGVDTLLYNGSLVHEASLTLRKDAAVISATVADYEPSLLTLLKKDAPAVLEGLYLAKDQDSQALYAAYEVEGRYIVLSAKQMSEKDFQRIAEELK